MGRFDRYILTQLIVLFGFFSLVLISVYWIEAAVDLFDSLIADGQNLGVFLEFTALALPQIMMLVLPIAAFVATLYIFNRMIGESELVVLQTAGLSAWRLLRPVLVFGLFLAALVGILANILAPAARSQFIDRSAEVQEDLTGRFLRAGEFIHPTAGLTVYIREITELGEFRDLFLQDSSQPGVEITYTATTALLVRSEAGPRLVMFDGMAQSLDRETGRLSTVTFADFTYDVAALIAEGRARNYDVRELPTAMLVRADAQTAEEFGLPLARMLFEGHDRIARAIFSIFPPLIGAACLMLGHFSRFGVWRQILLAVVLVVPLQVIWNASEAVARADAERWYLAYAQPVAALLVTLVLVVFAGSRRKMFTGYRRRARAEHGGLPA
ncbi:LPS export ABC transporter permease LptF [Roseibacterium sp. SDUM158016]|uniref:LPS export ABC transporter permease LptF n=1 Tax=Roseicyclus sediminis TaxID=2980997 RepID=UPI0021D3B86D|nr:LPS export ABC transporter permease LptF [Roseibacterium sp. SDUM158016]MCU4653901.1 LPS export ABC transporter permease LptF [Roseibacterium sp. SDUM158016]